MSALAAAALACLHASGARPRRAAQRGPQALTTSERRIVEFAAGGLSNRAIGETLVLMPRTVEWHLGHAYRKLGVASRRDLPSALGRPQYGA
ncbi:MAG TPA: helix-turn-helix transcriptional regulator [Baekduia sp.]|nr:helix-turn-helix transcriptional regulator [Baekduia sp.]